MTYPLEDWEFQLLAPAEPVPTLTPDEIAAERVASDAYAAEYGYDVDPATGRYLSPSEAEEVGVDIDGDDIPDHCCPDATTAATKLCGCWS